MAALVYHIGDLVFVDGTAYGDGHSASGVRSRE